MPQLVRLKYYNSSIEANRDKQILLDEGIKSFIANEQTIQSDWLLSQAIGGIQLHVFDDQLAKAQSTLSEFYKSDNATVDVEHTIAHPDFDFNCPKCGSNHLYQDEKPGGIFGLSILFLGIPIKVPSTIYHCYYCGHEFKH